MFYARIEDGSVAEYPLTPAQIKEQRAEAEDISIDNVPEGFVFVYEDTSPEIDYTRQKLVRNAPQFASAENKWVVTFDVVDVSAQRIDSAKAAQIRKDRNALLASSDWTQVADAPVDKTLWATYRQALRDISSQSGFPLNVIWPEQPTQ